jgi:deazaflavin-dependent oxidoreductase (nitroreductase family)
MQPKLDWRKSSYWIPASKFGSWFISSFMDSLDKMIFKLTGGRQTVASAVFGLPSIILTTTGAKSGQKRNTPLVGIADGKNFIVIASNWGKKNHPAWYYNITANPEVEVGLNGVTKPYKARRVEGEEREQCWAKATKVYPGYNAYKQRAGRNIGVFVLEPQNK